MLKLRKRNLFKKRQNRKTNKVTINNIEVAISSTIKIKKGDLTKIAEYAASVLEMKEQFETVGQLVSIDFFDMRAKVKLKQTDSKKMSVIIKEK